MSGIRKPRIHLVRHGEVENAQGVVYGRLPGFGLSARGKEQAREAARALVDRLGESVVIVSSPLERARETAALMHEAIREARPSIAAVEVDERLIEVGSPFDGLPRRFAPIAYARRWLDESSRRLGERPRAVAARMREAITALSRTDADDVILVSHQFPIRMAVAAHAPWRLLRARSSHASITTLEFDAGEKPAISYWEPIARGRRLR